MIKTPSLFLALLLLCLPLPGCGKKGPPVPQDQKKQFAWQSAEATLTAAGCLNITAKLSGATENVERFTLELEPEGPDICVECPFNPVENVTLTPQDSMERDDGILYLFAYCPQRKADSYRWRLVARNVFNAFPHALTPLRAATYTMPSTKSTPRPTLRMP